MSLIETFSPFVKLKRTSGEIQCAPIECARCVAGPSEPKILHDSRPDISHRSGEKQFVIKVKYSSYSK